MPPLVYDDLVLIGPGIGEHPMAGLVGAFRLTDGARVWRTSTIEPTSWPSTEAAATGGAGVWTPFTLDRTAGVVYVATGNPVPSFASHLRAGANLYANSLVALDVRTGTVRWFRQMTRNDIHDWDLTHAGPLFQTTVVGATRELVATSGKDGVLRMLDRQTHELLYEVAVTTRSNVDLPVTAEGMHAFPGPWGGIQWNGPAYHPGLATLFLNAVDWCGTFTAARQVRRVPGGNFVRGVVVQDPAAKAAGWLTAVDARTGGVRWRYRSSAPLTAAIAATGGGLVFTGELTGNFLALDAATGSVRYRFDTAGPIGAGVAVFATGGKQRVAVMSGRPSRSFTAGATRGRRPSGCSGFRDARWQRAPVLRLIGAGCGQSSSDFTFRPPGLTLT
jgi:alcohol dehydrogenase (cytochrome c)